MVLRSVFWWGSSVTMSVLKATVSVLPAACADPARRVRPIGATARSRTASRTTGDLLVILVDLVHVRIDVHASLRPPEWTGRQDPWVRPVAGSILRRRPRERQ